MDDPDIRVSARCQSYYKMTHETFRMTSWGITIMPVADCIISLTSSPNTILFVMWLCSFSHWWQRTFLHPTDTRLGLVICFGRWNIVPLLSPGFELIMFLPLDLHTCHHHEKIVPQVAAAPSTWVKEHTWGKSKCKLRPGQQDSQPKAEPPS